MDRRHFLKTTALTAAGVAAGGALAPEAGAKTVIAKTRLQAKGFVKEPARKVAVVDSADVVVVGGGPAGFAAAVAAARQGCDTLLLERGYFLGGLFTGCDVTVLNDMYTPTPKGRVQAVFGICDELCQRLEKNGMLAWLETPPNVDTEATKYFMEEMCAEAGVRILYGVQACDAIMSGDRVEHLLLETKSGRVAVKAGFVVDCSGDGDVLEWTGEDFKEYKYDISAMYRVGGVYKNRVGSVTPHEGVFTGHLGDGVRGVDGLDMYTLTSAQLDMRKRMWDRTMKLRQTAGDEKAFLLSSPSLVGVRITRVLNSVFNVTTEGAATSKSYDDVIGFTGSDSTLKWSGGSMPGKQRPMWQIPYRSLVPKKVSNLLVAGRCIGFEKELMYDAREVGTCLMTGQAAGTAAAQALAYRQSCREIDVTLLQKTLRANNVKLDW
ncbi:MAG: FAD-dependent oxidoreductase [Bacteroidales bacterium]|nr:FAD-dependent oxidoreductase [Bacteroidales bacterium]